MLDLMQTNKFILHRYIMRIVTAYYIYGPWGGARNMQRAPIYTQPVHVACVYLHTYSRVLKQKVLYVFDPNVIHHPKLKA